MSRWYRAYEGTVTDAKLGEAALVAGCSRSVAIAAWHSILENCATTQQGGAFDTSPRRVAVILCEPVATISALFDAFAELGMIGNGTVTAWKKRQYESDTSTERSKRHRQRKCNGDATLQQQDEPLQGRYATPPETETETETETECEKEGAHTEGNELSKEVQGYLDSRTDALTHWEVEFLISIKWADSLSKAQKEKLTGIREKLAPRDGAKTLPSVKKGTPAFDAWIDYYRRTGRPTAFYEKQDEITVFSEFPPQEQAA